RCYRDWSSDVCSSDLGARACLERAFAQALVKGFHKPSARQITARAGQATISSLQSTVPRSFGIRVALPFTLEAHGVIVPLRVYEIGRASCKGRTYLAV